MNNKQKLITAIAIIVFLYMIVVVVGLLRGNSVLDGCFLKEAIELKRSGVHVNLFNFNKYADEMAIKCCTQTYWYIPFMTDYCIKTS